MEYQNKKIKIKPRDYFFFFFHRKVTEQNQNKTKDLQKSFKMNNTFKPFNMFFC